MLELNCRTPSCSTENQRPGGIENPPSVRSVSTEKRVLPFTFTYPPHRTPILGRPFLPGLKSFVLPPLAHLVGPTSPWGTLRACSASASPSQPFWPVHRQCGPSVRSRCSQRGHLRSPPRGLEMDVFSKSSPERGLNLRASVFLSCHPGW